jgi:hypothetical protein
MNYKLLVINRIATILGLFFRLCEWSKVTWGQTSEHVWSLEIQFKIQKKNSSFWIDLLFAKRNSIHKRIFFVYPSISCYAIFKVWSVPDWMIMKLWSQFWKVFSLHCLLFKDSPDIVISILKGVLLTLFMI